MSCAPTFCVSCVSCVLRFVCSSEELLLEGFCKALYVSLALVFCVSCALTFCVSCVSCVLHCLCKSSCWRVFARRLCVCPMLPDFVCSMSCVCVCLPCVLCMCVCPVSCVCFLCPVFFWRIFARRLCVCPVLPSAGKLCIPCESPTPASGGLLQQIRSRKLSIKNNL